MLRDRPTPPRPGWRQAGGPTERTRTVGPRWRREGEAPGRGHPRWRRGALIVLVGSAFAICCGLLIWVSSWVRPPRPAALALIGAGYETNLAIPHNAYGREALRRLAGLARPAGTSGPWGSGRPRLTVGPRVLLAGEPWDGGIDDFGERTLVLVLALHGGSDPKGAYLLPDDAGIADDPSDRLRLDAVLDRLARLPESRNKVLILDATQVGAHWPLGMLHNDFARELAKLDARIRAIPNLVVLSASDVDQQSWSCDALGQTVFTHYLIAGLEGAAAGENGHIDTEGLYRYVLGAVRRWVAGNLQESQTPVLLPAGDVGTDRARRIELAVIERDATVENEAVPPAEPETGALVSAWKRLGELRDEVPSPAVHAPGPWREYRDVLLRCDQLTRAGAVDAAGRLAPRLADLEGVIRRSRDLALTSASNTLAMPAAEGRPVPSSSPWHGTLDALWDAPAGETAKRWGQLRAGATDVVALRLGLYDLLLGRVADDPARHLERAYQLAQLLRDPARPVPAEVHDLIMLHRDRPPDPHPEDYDDRVAMALRVRQFAERAALVGDDPGVYPDAEAVVPWARAAMAKGDAARRLGQDLLFASDPESTRQSGAHFEEAERFYREARAAAEEARGAFAVRDEVLAALPDYSRWLARRYLIGIKQRDEYARLLADAEGLWDATHTLVAALEADPDAAPRPPIAAQAEAVRRGYRDLESRFTQFVTGIGEVELPSLWHSTTNALRVPFDDPMLRAKLTANLRRIERQFLAGMRDVQHLPDVPTAGPPVSAPGAARRQGLMALGVLGRRRFDADPDADSETYDQVRDRLALLDVDPLWWRSATRAGEQVGARWRRLTPEIDRLLAAARVADPARSRAALRDADRLARQLDGGTGPATTDPALAYRRRLVQDLLLWQVGRTFGDRWRAEDPDTEPYYRVAGLLYLDDVRQLDDPARPARAAAADDWSRRLVQPDGLRLVGPGRLDVTSERQVAIEYRLEGIEGADPEIPRGFPVVWAEAGKDLRALDPPPSRRLVRRAGDLPDAPIVCTLESPLLIAAEADPPSVPRATRSSLVLRGLYRGQRLERTTAVDLYPLPDVALAHHVPTAAASVAVRAESGLLDRFGDSNGAIAIVLDCSGSMGTAPGQAWGPTVKYQEATDSLGRLLGKVARGTRVSVWIFGQSLGLGETVADAERTILPVQRPVTWDPDDPGQLRDLMARLEYPACVPRNESPIVRAMLLARDDLRNVPGFKTLLVLTDGMDNRFPADKDLNPGGKKSIPTALREAFGNSDVEINVIGYKVADPREEAIVREQFRVIEGLPQPGRFYSVKGSAELGSVLEGALRKRLRCWIEGEDNILAAGMSVEGLDISPLGANDRWFPAGLTPGGYQVVAGTPARPRKDVAFNRGDRLLIKLVEGARGIEFRRVDYSREDHDGRPFAESGDWRLAVLQNQRLGAGLQMLVTLEKAFDPRERRLQVIRPWEVWIEARPRPGAEAPFALRVANQPGYPAPAWGLDVPEWPVNPGTTAPARPALRAWWNPDQESPPAGSLDRGRDFELGSGRGIPPVRIDGEDVRLEGVRVEDHLVETRPGVRESKPCLVVRVDHAPGKPVWVRPRGLGMGGHEHRFYSEAHRYTGLFWPVTRDEARSALTGLEFVALADFKAKAERRGFALGLKDLTPPESDDVRPREIVVPAVPPLEGPFAPIWRTSGGSR